MLLSKQQDRIDQMNLLSETFFHGSSSLDIILEERLQEVNALWRKVQRRASSKQERLERCVREQTRDLQDTRQHEVTAFTENFPFLRSLFLTADCCAGTAEDDVTVREDEELYDEDLRNQIAFHELFEGLAAVEENVVTEVVVDGDQTVYHDQLARLQVRFEITSQIH